MGLIQTLNPNIYPPTILGKDSLGTVEKQGPYGNPNSPIKVAYIVGVHPRESISHQAVVEAIKSKDRSLNYSYYIYQIKVTQDAQDYEKGRANGQKLAFQYAVPDIKNQHFQLVVDVHSNIGNYSEKRFLFIPQEGTAARSIALNITNKISWLVIYSPPEPSSPSYVTIPLIESGTPAILYETYLYDPYNVTHEHAIELVTVIDNTDLKA